MFNVILEFLAETLQKRSDRHRRRIAQGANRPSLYIGGHRIKQIQIVRFAVATLNPFDQFDQPAGTFTARRTLPAGLILVKTRQIQKRLHHATGLVQNDDSACPQHRPGFRYRIIIHIQSQHRLTPQNR